ncbi:hypothetical protein [Wenzhouxiangella sp. 15190]|nr:hypothetical protein [Wenzhouxiangella sp. 15190]
MPSTPRSNKQRFYGLVTSKGKKKAVSGTKSEQLLLAGARMRVFHSEKDLYEWLRKPLILPETTHSSPDWKTCPTCGVHVKKVNYKKHQQRVHKNAEKDRSQAKRDPYGPEYDDPPDFLDLPNVVSGGGFGVGKKKK